MKRCPACGRTFTNNTLINCLNDGTPLVEDTPAPPPYFGTPSATAAPPPSTVETPMTATYADTPLSAIPELQSPEMQAALKEALEKAGMSSLLGADPPAHSTISVKIRTSSEPEMQFSNAGAPSAYYTATVAPHRKRSIWGGLIFFLLAALLGISGLRYIVHRAATGFGTGASMPTDVTAAIKNADDAEVKAVSDLNPAPLYSAYTGPALAREMSELDALKSARRTQNDQLVSQQFGTFKKSADGLEAQVDVSETWNTIVYAEPGHTVISQKLGTVNPQTVTLARTPHGWIVEQINFHHP